MGRKNAWLSLLSGVLLAGSAGYVLATRWEVLWAGHPIFPVVLVVAFVVGVSLVLRGLIRRERPRTVPRIVGAILMVVVAAVLAGAFWYLRPVPATNPSAAKTGTRDGITISATDTRIVLKPATASTRVLVFYPGARIDPRAYVDILRPVAAAGTEVRIVKEPFNIAFLATSAAADDLRNRPQELRAVAGHSLGGVVASEQAATLDARLVLWASYPDGSIAESGIEATSIYGSADGLAAPDQVRKSAGQLPDGARLVEIDGATHGSFGDFEPLPGDGSDGGAHRELQEKIQQASILALS